MSTAISNIFDHTKKIVNGPLNVVRLEGEINGTKKVLYCYMDIHLNPNAQSENENVFSTDVSKHFADNFVKLNGSDHMVDFFMEINPSMIQSPVYGKNKTNLKNKYIIQVHKLFRKSFKLTEDNKVMQSNVFKNTRFHYADIRDCLFINLFDELMFSGHQLKKSFDTKINSRLIHPLQATYSTTIHNLNTLDAYLCGNLKIETNKKKTDPIKDERAIKLQKIIESISAEQRKNTPNAKSTPPSMFKSGHENDQVRRVKLFTKYLNKYNHESVKENIHKLLTDIRMRIGGLSTHIKESIDVANYYFKKYETMDGIINFDIDRLEHTIYSAPDSFIDKMSLEIQSRHNKITREYLHILSAMMDIFMIRRFTDKDYITNAVYYSGASHSCNTIHWLVKNFGFKITHSGCSNGISEPDLEKLNKKIQQNNYPEMLMPILMPHKLNQSTDMTNMPDNYC